MRQRTRSSRGIALVLVATSLTALMGFAALGIDLAFLMEAQGQLASAADATAIAAASGLTTSPFEDAKKASATDRAITYAALNKVLGTGINLNAQTAPLDFGRWDEDTRTFQPNATPTDAVRVTFELTGSTIPEAPSLFFAPVLGQATGRIAASATAALAGSRDIVLALDKSGSMCDDLCGGPNRPNGSSCTQCPTPHEPITATKQAAQDFVDLLDSDDDQVGLVSYSTSAGVGNPPVPNQTLTDNFASVQSAISAISASGNTNIAAALCVARREVFSSRGRTGAVPVVILLSDGVTNTALANSSNPSDCRAGGNSADAEAHARTQAQRIAAAGGTLYTISLGNDTDEPFMQELAEEIGGGKWFPAGDTTKLEAIFIEISKRISAVLVE